MALPQPMYAPSPNSPETELSAAISATVTTISLTSMAGIPDAPNVLTIGRENEAAETVLYTGKSGNTLTGCTRGYDGTTAKSWPAGASAARLMTAQDLVALQANMRALADQQGEAASIPHSLTQGQTIVEAQQTSPAQVTVEGRTLVNLMGQQRMDSLTGTTMSNGVLTLDTTADNYEVGSASTLCTVTTGSAAAFTSRPIPSPLTNGKYYAIAIRIKIGTVVSPVLVGISGAGSLLDAAAGSSAVGPGWHTIYRRGRALADVAAGQSMRIGPSIAAGGGNPNGATYWADSMAMYEITAEEYAMDNDAWGPYADLRYPYIDGMQSVRGPSITVKGRNIAPWMENSYNDGSGLSTFPNAWENNRLKVMNGSSHTHGRGIWVNVLAGHQYTLSFKHERATQSGRVLIGYTGTDAAVMDQAFVTGDRMFTFTPLQNRILIRFVTAGTNAAGASNPSYFWDIMLVLGDASALPPSFVAREDQMHITDVTLHKVGIAADFYDASRGRKWVAIGERLLGGLTYLTTVTGTSADRIVYGRPTGTREVAGQGVMLVEGVPEASGAWDQASNIGKYSTTQGAAIIDFIVTKGTTRAQFEASANLSAKVLYRLTTPVFEDVPHSGALTVHRGANIVEVATGRIFREKVVPKLDAGNYYIQSADGSSYWGTSRTKLTTRQFLRIYNGAQVDDRWSIVDGRSFASANSTKFAAGEVEAAEWYVDYVVLDRHAYTTAIAEASVTVAANLGSAVGANTEDIARVKTHNDKQDTGIRELQLDAWALETMSANRNGYGVTAGTGAAYTVTLNPAPVGLSPGLRATVKLHAANLANATINANGFGAVPIRTSGGAAPSAGFLVQDGVYTFVHDGSAFILQGEGGGGAVDYGNAARSDVASGKSFAGPSGLLSGTGKLVNVTPNTGYPVNTINVPLPQVIVDFATSLYPSRLFTVGVSASVHFQFSGSPNGMVFYSTLVMIFKKVADLGTPGIEMIAGVISPTGAITAFNQDGSFDFNYSSDPMVTVQNKYAAFEYVAAWP